MPALQAPFVNISHIRPEWLQAVHLSVHPDQAVTAEQADSRSVPPALIYERVLYPVLPGNLHHDISLHGILFPDIIKLFEYQATFVASLYFLYIILKTLQ